MPFARSDFEALVAFLGQNSRERSEFRQLVFPEESVEGRLDALDRRLADLQEQTDRRFAEMAEAQKRFDQRMQELAKTLKQMGETQGKMGEAMAHLARTVDLMAGKFGNFEGLMLECRYRKRTGAYFGWMVRSTWIVDIQVALEELQALLEPAEVQEVLDLDVVVSGCPRIGSTAGEVWIALEISVVADREDVRRARRRADLLARTGRRVVPAVGGHRATEGAESERGHLGVVLFEDGKVSGWEKALARALESQ